MSSIESSKERGKTINVFIKSKNSTGWKNGSGGKTQKPKGFTFPLYDFPWLVL